MGSKLNRSAVPEGVVSEGLMDLYSKLNRRLVEKGRGAYASRHEILGILEEEMDEVKDAIRCDTAPGYDHFAKELLDVAVGALFGYICMKGGYISHEEKDHGKRNQEGSDNRNSLDATGGVHTS